MWSLMKHGSPLGLTDRRNIPMKSYGGTRGRASRPTSRKLMFSRLEAVRSLAQHTAVSAEKSKESFFSHCSRKVQRRYLTSALILAALFCMSTFRLEAQSTFGSIRGTVQDSTGAAIPDAQITLHSLDENTERKVTADASGSYAF